MFGMGINNEGISPSVKAYLWKSVGVPSLVYALGTCNINQSDLKRLESFQGTVINRWNPIYWISYWKTTYWPSKTRIQGEKSLHWPCNRIDFKIYSDGYSHQRYSHWSIIRKRSCSIDECFWFCLKWCTWKKRVLDWYKEWTYRCFEICGW